MSDKPSLFENTLSLLKKKDQEIEESIDSEKYSEDFEDEAEGSAKKASPKKAPLDKQSPTKKNSPLKPTPAQKKLDFPETGLKLPTKSMNETDKPDESRRSSDLGGAAQSPQKTKQSLDSATLERIDLEECFIELKGIFKKKRVLFLQFCEEKENNKIKAEQKLRESDLMLPINPFRKLEKDQEKEEIQKSLRKGIISSNDFIDVLKRFEFRKTDRDLVLKFLKATNCYFQPTDCVFYLKLLRQMLRRVSNFNKLTNTFEYIKPLKTFPSEASALDRIRTSVHNFKRKTLKKVTEEKKKLEEDYSLDMPVDDIAKDPNKFLQVLREKVTASNKSLNDIFKSFDVDNDGTITYAEFRNAMLATGIHFSELVLKQVFKRLDKNEGGSVSYMEFLSAIYSEKNEENIFDGLSKAESTFKKIQQIIQANFNSYNDMRNNLTLKQSDKMSEYEFKVFVSSVTDMFSRLQLSDVFVFLDPESKGFLDADQIRKLYEGEKLELQKIAEKKKIEEEKKVSFKESEKAKEEEAKKAEQREKMKIIVKELEIEGTEATRLTEKRANEYFGKKDPKEKLAEMQKQSLATRYYPQEALRKSDLLEKFMVEFSNSALNILKSEGKNLRDLFNIFSKEVNGFLNQDEFYEASKMIMNENVEPEFTNSFFNFFVVGYPKKMTFKVFSHIIFTGKKGNSIYIKLKHRFKQTVESSRKIFMDEFQRLDATTGTGEILLSDLIQLFALNDIKLDENDIKLLESEEIITTKKERKYIKYPRFMKIIFPESNPIEKEIQLQAALKLKRFLLRARAKKNKERLKIEEMKKAESLQQKRSPRGRGSVKNRSASRTTKKVTIQPESERKEDLSARPKLKEVYEFEKGAQLLGTPRGESALKTPTQTAADKRRGTSATRRGGRKVETKELTMEEKLKKTLGEPAKDDRTKEKVTAIHNKCKSFIMEIIDNVIAYGESLKLSKEIQKKYETRPVIKDVFVTLQDLEIDIIDLIPRSLSISTNTGRVGYMDKDGNLYEYDIANKQNLKSVNLSSKVPLKKSRIIDYAFDNKAGRIYTLTDSWMLEVWEIHQELSVPVSRLKILTENYDPNAISNTYFKRYGDTFPHFMSLSTSSHQLLIINCSCINNSIVFVDPVSVSVFSQVFLKQDDYKVPPSLTKTLHFLKPKLDDMVKNLQTFEKMFESQTFYEDGQHVIPKNAFIETFKAEFHVETTISDIELSDLYDFLDQNSDGKITLSEVYYLQDIAKTIIPKGQEETITLPATLQGLDEGSLKTLQKLNNFIKRTRLNLQEAFKIFDDNNSGSVSASEFFEIIDQLIEDVSFEDKENILKVADQDRNGSINFQEFCSLFADVEQYNTVNEMRKGINLRTHLFTLFEKAYIVGIDVEAEFLKYDSMAEGTLQIVDFKSFIRSLPFGLLESEIEEVLQREVIYTDNGRIDYQQIIQNPEFKKSKIISKIKDTTQNKQDLQKLMHHIESDQNFFEPQKIIVESVIYIDDFDLMVYTTQTPRTSTIFISSTKRNTNKGAKMDTSQIFSNKLLAKLEGHRSSAPPTIYYCSESGCLISGDKIDKKIEFNPKPASTRAADGQPQKEQFINFYTNIETNKQFSTDILIWNLQKDLFDLCNTNPPWIVRPTHVIKGAHYDSILDITYLPVSQLIVSASVDKTIKVWDPVARPYSLKHPKNVSFIREKPGIYGVAKEQETITNQKFTEVKRIYTGDQTCHKLTTAAFRIPITNMAGDANFTGKHANLEMLLALCLSKPQLTGQTMKSTGLIKGYSIDRLELEIPANRVDDVIPRKYYKELEDLCLERRKKALVYLQHYLPNLLETMKVKIFIQENDLKKIVSLFKKVSLLKFSPTEKGNLQEDVKELFKVFTSLPLRVSFDKFISEAGLQKQLSIPEIFYYLKKFRQIHPLNITKSEFFRIVEDVNTSVKKTILSEKKTLNPLIEDISKAIKTGKVDFKEDLFNGQKKGVITRDQLVTYIENLGLYTNDKDMDQLLNSLDPYIVNKVKLETLEDMFGNEILEYKLGIYSRPNQIIKNLTGHMDGKQKMLLIFCLNECNLNKDNYITKDEFLQAFITSGIPFNKLEVLELFELLAEHYSKTDSKKFLNLNYFSKKLFTPAENFELMKIYFILGKLKNGFVFKRTNPQHIFAEYNPETKTYSKTINDNISTQDFINRIESINIPNLHKNELEKVAYFLSIKNELSNTPFVPLSLVLYYFRRLEVKYQFLTLTDISKLYDAINYILAKESEVASIYNRMTKKKLDHPGLRHILNEIKVDIELIDEILARFLDDNETHLEHFMTKLKNFVESISSAAPLSPPKNARVSSPLFEKQAESPARSPTKMQAESPTKGKENFDLSQLLRTKTRDDIGKSIQLKGVSTKEHIQNMVNAIRAEGKETINNIKKTFESFDTKKTGKLKLATCVNIIMFNCKGIKEDLALKFQSQYEKVYKDSTMDYQSFIDEYLTDKEAPPPSQRKTDMNINTIMVTVAAAIKASKVNINYAFRFFDEKLTGNVTIEDFKKLFAWIKANIKQEEFDYLIEFFRTESFKIDYTKFLTQIEVSNHNLSVIYDKSNWTVASEIVKPELLEKISANSEYIKFMINQKLKETTSPVQLPLLPALTLHKALGNFKYEFTLKEIDDVVNYAILGSQVSPQEAQKKLKDLEKVDVVTELINLDHFFYSIPDILANRKDINTSPQARTVNIKPLSEEEAKQKLEEKHLISKIKGILKDRDVTLWDSIVSSDMTITEQSKISLHEFGVILNSLNLGLTLKEKLMLNKIADPHDTKRVDLKALIDVLEEKALSEKVMKVILEKLGIALFFNDLSFKAAFDYFDVDKDDSISFNEFIFGFSQLDLGLSIFEIQQMATMIDIDKNGVISRAEFTQTFEELFKKYMVDPSKDLSFSLYAKIKNLLSVKGIDLLDCLKDVDIHRKGWLTYDAFVKALNNFGLENLQPYQINALLKLNKIPPNEETKGKPVLRRGMTAMISPKNPDYKVYYEGFYENLIREVEKNLKMVIEVTHDLLRKIYKMIQSKNVSIFEAFVHFDINLNNAISKLEFKLGLQNFNIYLSERDINLVWNSFEKGRSYKVSFNNFIKPFIDAGALQIIKFDEGTDLLLKKFVNLMQKIGNFEEAFRRLDANNSGFITYNEFKEQIPRLHLGLLPNEIEIVFNNILQMDKEKTKTQDPNKGFTYRQFVRLALKYKNLSLVNNIFAKIYNNAKERKMIWRQQFTSFKSDNTKAKNAGDLSLRDLKAMLRNLKLGITNEEIDTVINSFDSSTVNYQTFEKRIHEGAKSTEESNKEKNLLIYSLVNEINAALGREKIPLERVFFDFDTNQTGTLDLSELTNLIFFLKITASKNQVKTFFEAIDYDRKGYITLIELKSFLEESKFQQGGVNDELLKNLDKEKSKYEEIYLKVKEGLVNANLTLQRLIYNTGHKLSEVMTKQALEKMLLSINIVLKKEDLELFFGVILESAGNRICSFEDFQNFAIKNQIEIISFDDKIHHVHPAIAVYIEKMNNIYKKLEINPTFGFKYLAHPTRNVILKRTFMRAIQSFNLNLTQDDIVLLYEYFDEKNYGEINYETFLEKFELLITMGILKLSGANELEEESGEAGLGMHKISSRHQLIGIMQKIYMYFVEKKYNKRQMVALFDKNGNGILTKDDFIEGIKALGLDIPLEKARVLSNYLDNGDRGVIEVDDFVSRVQHSMPQNLRGDLKSSQAINVLRNVVDRLREQVPNFLKDMVRHERSLKSEDQVLYRPKTGIYVLDFYKLLKDYGINLNEDDKVVTKDVYLLPSSSNYLDIETVYKALESLSNTLSTTSSLVDAAQEDKELNEMFEQKVYRRIGDQLRKMNISILQAFDFIDRDKNGYITEAEMRTLFKNLNLDFTEREIAFLISKFEGAQHGVVSKKEFVDKFWHSYAKFGQKMEVERIKDLKSHQRKIVTNTLNFCKNKKKWTLEEAWVNLDYNKNGLITLDDLRNSLIGNGHFITKEDIALLYNFIDSPTQDGKVDFMEFCDFWQENTNLFDEGIPMENEIKQLEYDILEHVAKILDQREISLWDFYQETDITNKGYLTEREFSFLLRKAGLDIDDVKVEKLMRMIDANSDKRIAFSELEARLLQAGLRVKKEQEMERIRWIDKGMKNMLVGLNSNLKLEGYDEFFKKFDSDFDGYLTPEEFFNALRSFGKIISSEQAERIANICQTNLSDNRISIQKIVEVMNHILANSDAKAQQYEIASIGEDIFYYIVINFEGINRLFSALNDLKKNFKDIYNYIAKNRKKIRGYSLLGFQNSSNNLASKLSLTNDHLQKGMNLLMRASNNFIVNDKLIKLIDPTQNVSPVDKELTRERDFEMEKVQLYQIGDNAAFNVDYDSINYLSAYVKFFNGYYFRTNTQVNIVFYDKDTLSIVCTDGNQFYKHLDFELKLQNMLITRGDYSFKYIAKYEKRVGLDSSEKDVYLINEYIDETKWISLKDLIRENGGLLRIPFLTRTKAVIYIIKFWASQILKIMLEVHKMGCALLLMRPENIYISKDGQKVKFRSLRGCGKLSEFGKVLMAPDFYINLFDPDVKVNPENNTTQKSERDAEKIFSDPYLAPEMIFSKIQDLDQNVDTWTFGCLMYHILFGITPTSFYEEIIKIYPQVQKDVKSFTLPSDYFFHDLYPDTLINDILTGDHELPKSATTRRMVDCINQKSYEAFFNDIIPQKNILNEEFNKNNKEHLNRIGCYLDLIAACLDFTPAKRPTIQGLFHSPVFQLDKYENMISRQFSEIMIFYKSPSLTIRDKVLSPLRKICAKVIENPKSVIKLENDILAIMDIVNWSLIERKPKVVEDMKKSTTIRFNTTDSSKLSSKLDINDLNRGTGGLLIENEKSKANNQLLVKFIFQNHILDHLVFLALRHHTQSRKYLKKRSSKIDRTYDDTVRLLKGLTEIFKSVIFDMVGYQTSSSSYVRNFLENFVKFFLGEEFKLASDIADLLSGNQEHMVIRNTYNEYLQMKADPSDSFFRDPNDEIRDDADKAWKKSFTSRPYLFTESHWTPDLYLIVGPIYKESVSESGSGSVEYPVIQDFIRFETENNRDFDFDMQNRMDFMNHKTSTYFRRTVDYYNDIMHISENLQILYQADARSKSNIRVSLQYLKALLQSNNTDKIKLLLDSKIIINAMKYLAIDDVHIKTELLEMLYEISKGFEREPLSLITQEKNEAMRTIEENLKTVGVISQLKESKIKDKGTKDKLITYSYDYYSFNKQINNKYIQQLGLIFESPVVMTYLTAVVKTQAELLHNKKLVIKVFENITNGPLSVIKALNYSSTDTVSSICKIFITSRKGIEIKQNSVLAPLLVETFKKILSDCRPELIDYLNNIPGTRVFLREQGLDVPPKLNLTLLDQNFTNLADFYNRNRDKLLQEIQGGIIAARIGTTNHNTDILLKLNAQIYQNNTMIASWLTHYYKRKESGLVFVDVKLFFDKAIDLYISIFDNLIEYAQLNDICSDILNQIGYLFESIGVTEFYYLFVTPKDMDRAAGVLNWVLDKIFYFFNFYAGLDVDERQNELKEREDDLRVTTAFGREKKMLILSNILNKQSLKRYGENRLMPTYKAFLRILYFLVSLNNNEYNTLLKKIDFSKYFVEILKAQYHIISSIIQTGTENVHLIMNYAEESQIRLKTLEKIFTCSDNTIKEEFIKTGIIHDLCSKYLKNYDPLDVSTYKLTLKFLPFRNFLPIRNEALAVISMISQHKEKCPSVYTDLILALTRYSNLRNEHENLMKYKKGLIHISSLYFFTVVLQMNDPQIIHMLKQENTIDYLKDLFSKSHEMKHYYSDLAKMLEFA